MFDIFVRHSCFSHFCPHFLFVSLPFFLWDWVDTTMITIVFDYRPTLSTLIYSVSFLKRLSSRGDKIFPQNSIVCNKTVHFLNIRYLLIRRKERKKKKKDSYKILFSCISLMHVVIRITVDCQKYKRKIKKKVNKCVHGDTRTQHRHKR